MLSLHTFDQFNRSYIVGKEFGLVPGWNNFLVRFYLPHDWTPDY
jgi:hypothetical protein